MNQTIAQKIIASHCGRATVGAGEMVAAKLNVVFANELSAAAALEPFESIGAKALFDPDRVILVPDHFTPCKDIASAEICKRVRDFARRYSLNNYFEVGRGGIAHVLLPERGFVLPGSLIAGADSHTTTYGGLGAMAVGIGSTDLAAAWATGEMWLKAPETIRVNVKGALHKWVTGYDVGLACISALGMEGARYCAVEVGGTGLGSLSVSDRLMLANLLAETGAKAAIVETDNRTREYLRSRTVQQLPDIKADAGAEYVRTIEINLDTLDLMVAPPPSPANGIPADEMGGVKVDQVVIGLCTAGRIEELRIAAEILRSRKVHPDVRLIVIPGSQDVVLEATKEGLIQDLIAAGAAVSTPTCGPCIGGHMGVLAAGERCVVTGARNFTGRMGHKESEIYMSGPAVAAASAVAGMITTPERLENVK